MMAVIFEDHGYETLNPLSALTPISDLIVGSKRIGDRAEELKLRTTYLVRPHLVSKLNQSGREANDPGLADEEVLMLNSRLLIRKGVLRALLSLRDGEGLVSAEGDVVAARFPARRASLMIEEYSPDSISRSISRELSVKKEPPPECYLVRWPWDLVPKGLGFMKEDLRAEIREGPLPSEVKLLGPKGDFMAGEDVEFTGPVFVDVRGGPVVIEGEATVGPFSFLEGPTFVRRRARIMSGARLSECYIGEEVRVGGEVQSSVISPFSNDYHQGYLGHSYLGSWVNIGAGTVTSDLKNTYGKVMKSIRGQRVSTGLRKVGSFMADHAKASIGTMLFTATYVGAASHVHGYVTEDVPPFTIYARTLGWGLIELRLESAIITYRRMCARRNVEPMKGEEEAIRSLFGMTEGEKRARGVQSIDLESVRGRSGPQGQDSATSR